MKKASHVGDKEGEVRQGQDGYFCSRGSWSWRTEEAAERLC